MTSTMWTQIVPQLRTIQPGGGTFTVMESLHVRSSTPGDDRWVERINSAAARLLQLPFPLLRIIPPEATNRVPDVVIERSGDSKEGLPEEGYELSITPRGITIRCASNAGRAHALATLT
ncbi:MAG: glycoside hydrolase family 20 zincin-like fold domain-containing protein, partial [Alkalispirochaeta sp.]